jgi:hypothetical protein
MYMYPEKPHLIHKFRPSSLIDARTTFARAFTQLTFYPRALMRGTFHVNCPDKATPVQYPAADYPGTLSESLRPIPCFGCCERVHWPLEPTTDDPCDEACPCYYTTHYHPVSLIQIPSIFKASHCPHCYIVAFEPGSEAS